MHTSLYIYIYIYIYSCLDAGFSIQAPGTEYGTPLAWKPEANCCCVAIVVCIMVCYDCVYYVYIMCIYHSVIIVLLCCYHCVHYGVCVCDVLVMLHLLRRDIRSVSIVSIFEI